MHLPMHVSRIKKHPNRYYRIGGAANGAPDSVIWMIGNYSKIMTLAEALSFLDMVLPTGAPM